MRFVALIACATVGCSFSGSSGQPIADGGADDDGSTAVDAPATSCEWEYTPLFVDPCSLNFNPEPALDGSVRIDTDAGSVRVDSVLVATLDTVDVDGESVAVWAVDSLDTAASFEIVGGPALLIAVDRSAALSGLIDLTAADVSEARPAGSRAAEACGSAAGGRGGDDGGGASGGGGGGNGTAGAPGGVGNQNGGPTAGGIAGEASTQTAGIRGGCDGGDGGDGRPAGNGGTGGYGGGALHLVARTSIVISGSINAGGVGGNPGDDSEDCGGAGGGAGGYIGLESLAVDSSGNLAANGGAAGGGTSGNDGPGGAGTSGQLGLTVATGGAGGGNAATTGGNGAVEGTAATSPTNVDNGGGGGGGGGLGIIRVRSMTGTLGGTISPAPMTETIERQ